MKTYLFPLPDNLRVARYGVAVAAGILAVLVRGTLDPVLGGVGLYVTAYMAIAFCAVVCGLFPALLTATIALGGILYWFVDSQSHLPVLHRHEIRDIVGFFLTSVVLTALGGANRRKELKLNETVVALTTEAKERRKAEQSLREAHDQLEQRVQARTSDLAQALSSLEYEVTVRKEAESQLRALTTRIMACQDQERRRIARDLHDTTGQTLAAVKMTIAELERTVGTSRDGLRLIRELNSLTDQASQEIRTTSYLLHPPLLDEAGFLSAARWFVEGFAKRSGIEVHCQFPQSSERMPKECELPLFRILQEGLTNVHRYSGASHVQITLSRQGEQISLEVRDDGCGISPDRLQQLQQSDGLGVGIAGMRERMRELGGTLDIRSDEKGTILRASLPVTNEKGSKLSRPGVPAA